MCQAVSGKNTDVMSESGYWKEGMGNRKRSGRLFAGVLQLTWLVEKQERGRRISNLTSTSMSPAAKMLRLAEVFLSSQTLQFLLTVAAFANQSCKCMSSPSAAL